MWLELMLLGRALVHLHRYELELARAVLSQARPVMEAKGNPAWKVRAYYHFLAIQRAIEHRYRVDEDDLDIGRTAVSPGVEAGDEAEIAHDTNYLGLLLLCHGDLAAAREQLELSLAIADRMGYLGLHQTLKWLSMTALRRGDVEAVRLLATEAVEASEALGHHPEVVAGAPGCLAWLAWQDDRPHDVLRLAGEAEQLMSTLHRTTGSTQVPTAWYGSLNCIGCSSGPSSPCNCKLGMWPKRSIPDARCWSSPSRSWRKKAQSSRSRRWSRPAKRGTAATPAARVTLKEALMLAGGL